MLPGNVKKFIICFKVHDVKNQLEIKEIGMLQKRFIAVTVKFDCAVFFFVTSRHHIDDFTGIHGMANYWQTEESGQTQRSVADAVEVATVLFHGCGIDLKLLEMLDDGRGGRVTLHYINCRR
ncbi:hypothetical protein TNCV_4229521 [Trichonephila clavipes]|nr:hypothetical protein TNCV_4229521 [Trichonephila clavipes]